MADLITALPALLQNFSDPLRAEAERLAEDLAVITLDLTEEGLDAEVLLDSTTAHVRWSLTEGKWEPATDLEDENLVPLACCLALIGLKRMSTTHDSAAVSLPIETMQIVLERKHARKLSPEEESYVQKIEKRFERYKKLDAIFDQDLVRLHPKWSIQSSEPLELWAEAPENATEFWNYIALALNERNLPFPAFLRAITDLDATRGKLKSWRQTRSVPQWVQRIRKFATSTDDQKPGRSVTDCRLLITVNDARLQVKYEAAEKFTNVQAAHLDSLRMDYSQGYHRMPSEAELLLVACFFQMQHSEMESFRLELERHASWLGTLFLQPALHPRLVTLDELPFELASDALRWSATDNADATSAVLRLIQADGSPVPLPLRVLPGIGAFYLSSDRLYKGPPWFGDEPLVETEIEIPMAALGSSDGIAFLNRLEAPLPKSLAERIRHEILAVEIKAECSAGTAGTATQYAHLTVTASSPDGSYVERLRGHTWVVELDENKRQGAIVCHDRSPLEPVRALLSEIKATFDDSLDVFKTRMTRNFPETFHRWAQAIPEAVKLSTDDQLGGILADPLIARVKMEAQQSNNIDWFDLKIIFEIEGLDLKAAEIRRLLAANGGFVKLADGSWRRVKIELSEEQQQLMDQMGIDINDPDDQTHRLHWRHLVGDKGAALMQAKAWATLQEKMAAVQIDDKPDVPTALTFTLRPYQVDGFHFLCYLAQNGFGGILADDMGLGKTVQTITWILWLRSRATVESGKRVPPVIVVCPKSVLDVWAAELNKAAPDLKVQVLHEKDELELTGEKGQFDVLVLNYAQLRSCIDMLSPIHWMAIILDEGQQIKNPDSKAAKAARTLVGQNRLVLTGTPLENRLLDLWSLMSFATPGALGDRKYFHKHFDRRKDERAAQRLSARLRPFILRRTKGQVAQDLPARTEENLLCEMSEEQAQLYKDELARAQQMMLHSAGLDALNKNRFAILQALTRLRQICCHPSLVNPAASEVESAKLTAAMDLMEQLHEEGHKVLFFSQFVSMLKIVREKLEAMNLPYHWLTGASDNRADIVRKFQEDENASVFLISLKAGGSGLNLTAASYVILYDPWWNPAVENQAIDRAHRIGQTQPVIAYRLLTKNSIEEKILTLQQQKKMLSNDILGEASFAQNLGLNDFEFLLGMERSLAEPVVDEDD
jgi:superfamily II DNA or RNA helicase